MRCYFMRHGHIFGVELIDDKLSDAEAIEHAEGLFAERAAKPSGGDPQGFELWERNRFIYRHPPSVAKFRSA